MLLGDPQFAGRVHATGGRFAFDDDQEVPDTQVVAYEFPKMVLTFELTGYPPYMTVTLVHVGNIAHRAFPCMGVPGTHRAQSARFPMDRPGLRPLGSRRRRSFWRGRDRLQTCRSRGRLGKLGGDGPQSGGLDLKLAQC